MFANCFTMIYNDAKGIQEVCCLKIREEIERLRELLNKTIEMEADTNEINKISQRLDMLIVEFMTTKSSLLPPTQNN